MTNELEKRLRELVYEHFERDLPERTVERFHIDGFKAALLTAARIGAEMEREECAALFEERIKFYGLDGYYLRELLAPIRARK